MIILFIVFKLAHNTAMCVNVHNNNQVKFTDFSISQSTTECVSWTEDWPQSWCVHWAACWHSLHSGSRCLWSGGWRKESRSGRKRQKLLVIFYIWDFSFFYLSSRVMSCHVLSYLLLTAVCRLRPLGGATERSAVVAEVTRRVHLVLR